MPEELDPAKYHVISPNQKRNLLLLAVLVILITLPTFGILYYKFAVRRPAQNDREMRFEIQSGEQVSQISKRLEEEKLINSQFLFKIYIFVNHFEKSIQAGVYTIPAGTSVVGLVDLFGHGINDTKITFIEGWRVEEYAREAASKYKGIDYKNFVDLAKPYEGYLFPDTYNFIANADEETIIATLKDNFDKKTKDVLTTEALKKAELTKDETIKFASILEREIHKEEDRQIVAGILIKRWKNQELVGADATTQYARAKWKFCAPELAIDCDNDVNGKCPTSPEILECPNEEQAKIINWWPADLSQFDINSASLYNTRKNVGLPPTPIANPGLSSIKAVLNYQNTVYNYYLTDSKGITHYAKTLNEHNQNVQKYL